MFGTIAYSPQELFNEFWKVVVVRAADRPLEPILADSLQSHIREVIQQNYDTFVANETALNHARTGLQDFMGRIIEEADEAGSIYLRLEGFEAAKMRCGIIFWCPKRW